MPIERGASPCVRLTPWLAATRSISSSLSCALSLRNSPTIRLTLSNVSPCPQDGHLNMLSELGSAGPSKGISQSPHANTNPIGQPLRQEVKREKARLSYHVHL